MDKLSTITDNSIMPHQRKSQHIQNRFIVFFVLVSLPPLFLLGAVASWSVTTTRIANVAELEEQLTQNVAVRTEKAIHDSVEAIELHVPDKALRDIALVIEAQREGLLEQFMAAHEFAHVEEVIMISADGREIEKLRRDRQPAPLETESVATSPAFVEATTKGRYFSSVSFENGVPMMTVAARILNGRDEVIGLFTTRMKLAFIQNEVLQQATLGNRGSVMIVDGDGRVIGHSRASERIGQTLKRTVLDMWKGVNDAQSVSDDRYWNETEEVFASARFIPSLRLGVIAEWPVQDALQIVRVMQRQIVIFVLVTLGLLLAASVLLARQVTKPIQILRAGASIIGSGKFDHQIILPRDDELGQLATSMNEMAVQLKKVEELKAIQIRNEALAGALKKEQELSRQKDVFISVMSHQLRTPLTAMQWGMEYLSGELGKPELKGYVDTIKDAAQSSQQITAIVDDLLTVSELGIGYTVKKTEQVDLMALLKELSKTVEKKAKEKKVTWSLDLPTTSLFVDANSNDMRKVFVNILDNAVTYTNTGAITIRGTETAGNVLIEVTDTGIGVPVAEQKDIFREFFRATNAIVGKNVGTGLGLFIVKTIVRAHGGTVEFVSEENKGTTCTITIPKQRTAINGNNSSLSA